MSNTIIDAGVGRPVPITRRRLIRTGGLAAIAAGLLGTIASPVTAAPAPPATPLIVGSTTNMADLVDEVHQYVKQGNASWEDEDVAKGALRATLSTEQDALFYAYERAQEDRSYIHERLYVAELARHLPGLAPALWAIWFHMTDGGKTGACCLPDGAGTRS